MFTEMDMAIVVGKVFPHTIQISHYYILIVPKSTKSKHLGFAFITLNLDFVTYDQPFYKPQAPLDSTRNALHKAPINRTKQEIRIFDIPAMAVCRSRL
jgi:hypothetical protein